MFELTKKIMKPLAVSGKEGPVRDVLTAEIAPYVDEVYTDALGNLIAHKKGPGKKLMLAAHMDEIGFITTFIEENGFIRFAPVGGIDVIAAAYGEVVFENGTKGVLVPEGGVEKKELACDKCYVDIGAKSRKEAERRVAVGDCFAALHSVTRLSGGRLAGRPFDDRIGCVVLAEAARRMKNVQNDTYFVFTVQEEVGCRGSRTAAFGIMPDYALAFDVTGTGDTVGAKSMAVKLGGGAAIKIKDASVICNPAFVRALVACAKERKITHQTEVLPYGGTDTSSMQAAGAGCIAGAISIPTRYVHSRTEMVDMRDVEACVRLLYAVLESDLEEMVEG